MGRFNSARMFGAQDQKFQNNFNNLLDLLDTAYIVESMIDGKKLKIIVSNQDGLAFYDGSEFRGGISIVGNELSLLTDTIADPNKKEKFARFLNPSGGAGIYLFNTFSDPTVPFLAFREAYASIEPGIEERLGAYITYNDDSRIIFLDAETLFVSPSGTPVSGVRISVSDAGVLIGSVPIYANNAAAISGGLSAGHLYRSGGDPDVLYIVH